MSPALAPPRSASSPPPARRRPAIPVRVSDDLFFAVICVDDPDKARRALGVQVISEGDFVLL